jgi:hypothetical protein
VYGGGGGGGEEVVVLDSGKINIKIKLNKK